MSLIFTHLLEIAAIVLATTHINLMTISCYLLVKFQMNIAMISLEIACINYNQFLEQFYSKLMDNGYNFRKDPAVQNNRLFLLDFGVLC